MKIILRRRYHKCKQWTYYATYSDILLRQEKYFDGGIRFLLRRAMHEPVAKPSSAPPNLAQRQHPLLPLSPLPCFPRLPLQIVLWMRSTHPFFEPHNNFENCHMFIDFICINYNNNHEQNIIDVGVWVVQVLYNTSGPTEGEKRKKYRAPRTALSKEIQDTICYRR